MGFCLWLSNYKLMSQGRHMQLLERKARAHREAAETDGAAGVGFAVEVLFARAGADSCDAKSADEAHVGTLVRTFFSAGGTVIVIFTGCGSAFGLAAAAGAVVGAAGLGACAARGLLCASAFGVG